MVEGRPALKRVLAADPRSLARHLDANMRTSTLVLMFCLQVGCAARPTDETELRTQSIRMSIAENVSVYASDDELAIARLRDEIIVLLRTHGTSWTILGQVGLPSEWRSSDQKSFTTYVDDAGLFGAYSAYLRVVRHEQSTPLTSVVSSKSKLKNPERRRPIGVSEDFRIRLRWTCGRYTAALVESDCAEFVNDNYGFKPPEAVFDVRRLVFFRADDGKAWLVLNEINLSQEEGE